MSPTWAPNRIFSYIMSPTLILIYFLWADKVPMIAWQTITAPLDEGGLTLPHLQLYFLASQIYYIYMAGFI